MWLAGLSVAVAQVGPDDFRSVPNLFPPPDPVVVTLQTLPSTPAAWALPDGSRLMERSQSETTFTLDDPTGPIRRFFRSGEGARDPKTGFTVELTPKGLRGRKKLEAWTETTLIPWLHELPSGPR
ncbi:MAG: hypothetical protein AAGA48_11275 [Myxococcota bacterium]